MTTPDPLTFGSNSISVFKFEPFSYRWTYPEATTTTTIVVSSGIPSGTVTTTSSNATFASATGLNVPASATESIVIQAFDEERNLIETSSNSVSIGLGRFVTDVSGSLEGRAFPFFRNEPVVPTIFSAPFTLNSVPLVSPTLPVGVSFASNSPSQYQLTGTPILQTPTSNYLIIGSNIGATRFVTTRVTIGVSPERLILDVSGTGLVGEMEPGTAIEPQSLSVRAPPYPLEGDRIQYAWTTLPDGLNFTSSNGTIVSPGFIAPDASSTLILTGTPTVAAVQQFITAGLSQATVAVTATRLTQPSLSKSQSFLFSFAELVVFDPLPTSGFTFFQNTPLPAAPSSNVVRAQTYFANSNVPITSIISTNLRSDLSLSAVNDAGQVFITGTPATRTGFPAPTVTFRAASANDTRDITTTLSVFTDVATFTSQPAAGVGTFDSPLRFVVFRPLSNALVDYYPSPLTWVASSDSGRDVSWSWTTSTSLPDPFTLNSFGVRLDVSRNTAGLTGVPTQATPSVLNTTVRADTLSTGSFFPQPFASRTIFFEVIPDQFTFTSDPVSIPVLVQNKAMPPVRFSATALSLRTVQLYSGSNLPSGLTVGPFGRLSGTPTGSDSGTLTVVASTGATSGSNEYAYTIVPDDIVFFATPNPLVTTSTGSVSVQVSGLSYANTPVTNYTTDLDPSYGLSINSSSGLLTGTLSSIPLGVTSFLVSAQAGLRTDTLPGTVTRTEDIVTLFFDTSPSGGPVITSPTVFEYNLYQYVPFQLIQISATGTGSIRYFVRTTDVPAGVAVDQVAGTITGRTVTAGTRSFTVYAQDDVGVTPMTFVFRTVFPFIDREGVTPASAYTSLVRQYTAVNAARNAENNVVYPGESRGNGAFARPTPPNEITQTVDPKCFSTSNCT